MRIDDFLDVLAQIMPRSRHLITTKGNPLPIAANLDDSALQHDLAGVPPVTLEEGIRETATIFERLARAGRLDAGDLET
jgi:hypothetical protein